jgi:alkaline phosphatase D
MADMMMQAHKAMGEHGMGQEKNNLAAIASLQAYRATRWGANLDLFITDQRSYRSPEPDPPVAGEFFDQQFPYFLPEEAMEIWDAGATYGGAGTKNYEWKEA